MARSGSDIKGVASDALKRRYEAVKATWRQDKKAKYEDFVAPR